jgi:two-component system sensor histidine kinase DegS
MPSDPEGSAVPLAAQLREEIAALDRELAEIELLAGQARTEAARHEQKRVQATERLAKPDPNTPLTEIAEGYGTLVTLTKRATLMESQVDVLEGKKRALARYRDALTTVADQVNSGELGPGASDDEEGLPPGLSRVVLGAQEDLRREIARSMHDGPAQSLTNIVLQAQIVERIIAKDPSEATREVRLLVSMVQQTLEATKTFIFDVRPMVLDDLGLVPTLRRSSRERGRRAQVPVEFESMGADRRLPMDVESAVFRIVDEALGAYLSLAPERIALRLDWAPERLEAHVAAYRTPASIIDEPLPEVPTGDVPEAIKQMIQDRHDRRQAAVDAAAAAAIVVLPATTHREVTERAAMIGASVELLAGGGELQLLVPLPEDAGDDAAS